MERKFAVEVPCSGDCAHCGHNLGADWTPSEIREIVQRMEKGIEKYQHMNGPKKCITCGFKWIADPSNWKPVKEYGEGGSRLQCPQCGSMNIVGATLQDDSEETPKIEVVFPPSNRTPEEELERADRLLKPILFPWLNPENCENRDTVGDLFGLPRGKSPQKPSNDAHENDGLTVGSLYGKVPDQTASKHFTERPAHIWPETESDKLLEKKYEEDNRAAQMRFLVKNSSELEKRAAELGPRIRETLAEAERQREESEKEAAWRDVQERLRAKGITV